MGLVLDHVVTTKSGSLHYRRRVPKDVAGVIAKREFKRKLGDSRKDAQAAYLRYHAQVEREIATARKRLSLSAMASSAEATEREAYAEALRRRADLIAAGASVDDLVLTGENILDGLPQEEWVPVEVPPVDRHTINLLRLGPERYRPPEPTPEGLERRQPNGAHRGRHAEDGM